MRVALSFLKNQSKKAAYLGLQACVFVLTNLVANEASPETPKANFATSSAVVLLLLPWLSRPFKSVTGADADQIDAHLSYRKTVIKEYKIIVPLEIENAGFIGTWYLCDYLNYVGKLSDPDMQRAAILLEATAVFLFTVDPLFVKVLIRSIGSFLGNPLKDFFRISTDKIWHTPCQKIKQDYLESTKLAIYIAIFSASLYEINKLVEKLNFVEPEWQQLMSMLFTIPAFLLAKPFFELVPFLFKQHHKILTSPTPSIRRSFFSSYESIEDKPNVESSSDSMMAYHF